jgi:hypothetical protein
LPFKEFHSLYRCLKKSNVKGFLDSFGVEIKQSLKKLPTCTSSKCKYKIKVKVVATCNDSLMSASGGLYQCVIQEFFVIVRFHNLYKSNQVTPADTAYPFCAYFMVLFKRNLVPDEYKNAHKLSPQV